MIAGCIVLAAGASSRMGGANKLLADLHGKPVVAHVFDAIRAAALPAIVVTGRDSTEIAALSPFPTAHAADYAEGVSRSLRAGIAAAPDDWDAALICLADMPGVDPATLHLIAAQATRSALIVPTVAGRRGNPVLWGRDHLADLMTLEGDTGGRALFASRKVTELPVETPAILSDIDTSAALDAARLSL